MNDPGSNHDMRNLALRRLRARNWAVFAILLAFMLVIFAVTIIKGAHR